MAEIKNLLTQISDEGLREIGGWLQEQLLERRLVVRPESTSRTFERDPLFTVEIKLRVLTDSVGADHPSVVALQKQSDLLR